MLSIFNSKNDDENKKFFKDSEIDERTTITRIPKTQKVTEIRKFQEIEDVDQESDKSLDVKSIDNKKTEEKIDELNKDEKNDEKAENIGLFKNLFRKILFAFDAHIKFIMFSSVLSLLALGTIMIFSSSSKVAMLSENIGDPAFFLKKHLIFLGISFLGICAVLCIKIDLYKKWWKIIAFISFVMLILVLIPGIGKNYNGARRWLRFGSFGFQPSDLAKLAVVISLSFLIVSKQRFLDRFKEGFLPLIIFLGVFCAVLVVEPDFGTTLFLAATGLVLMIVGGVRIKQLVPIVAILLLGLTFFVITKFDHVKPRIETYLNPEADPLGKGYQIHNSLIALGSGGPTGVGLGNSHQALFYLPEESTDFIFAVLGEELGLIGTSLVLFLFMLILLSGMRLAYLTKDLFQKLLTVGFTLLIVLQALVNIMVVTATAPNKGIALPFISFGGSLTFFYLIAVGIMLRIAGENINSLLHKNETIVDQTNTQAISEDINDISKAA